MEDNIGTAEEFVKYNISKHYRDFDKTIFTGKEMKEMMIGFTKAHCKKQKKTILELEETNGTEGYKIYKESIMDAYPLDKIV